MSEVDTARRVAVRHLAFALRVHAAVTGASRGNACWSPVSVASALSLAEHGAGGSTAAELREVLLGERGADAGALAAALRAASSLEREEADEEPVLAVANTLWAREDLPIQEGFACDLSAATGGAIRGAPFPRHPEDARRMINANVAETTRGLIPELVPPGAVDADTVAAIVNALYLRTSWRHAFPEHATRDEPFHGSSGTRDVPTMRLTERLGYTRAGGWQAVTLPAAGGVEAAVLLPEGDLAVAESGLDAATLEELLHPAEPERVELSLPRFRVETDSPLTGPLAALGAATMFTDAADFSPLITAERLKVSEVLHKAVLRVDEHGLEGAAATAVMMVRVAMVVEPDPVRVRVDRPFLFLVRHRATGMVYFLARVTAPAG